MDFSKKELRKQIKLSLIEHSEELEKWSNEICDKIISSEIYKNADTMLTYMPLCDEVNVLPINKKSEDDGKSIFIPRIDFEKGLNCMNFYRFSTRMKTKSGHFGIQEPLTDCKLFKIDETMKDILILVPGRAFTKDGKRLGRGKAYYDIFLSKILDNKFVLNKKCRVHFAGVCFPIQIMENIPTDEHDILMDFIFF